MINKHKQKTSKQMSVGADIKNWHLRPHERHPTNQTTWLCKTRRAAQMQHFTIL